LTRCTRFPNPLTQGCGHNHGHKGGRAAAGEGQRRGVREAERGVGGAAPRGGPRRQQEGCQARPGGRVGLEMTHGTIGSRLKASDKHKYV